METFNVSISTGTQVPSLVSFLNPKPSFQFTSTNRFYISQKPHLQPFSYRTRFSLSRLRISAQFGHRSSRPNSLRRKFTDNLQVRPETPQVPAFENDDDNSISSTQPALAASEKETGFAGGSGVTEVDSEAVGHSRDEVVTSSVLWNKLEGWVEQYKKDIEFWGLGSSPIFIVHQDLNGNVERVSVDEGEILRRSGVPTSASREEIKAEDFGEVSLKIARSRFLAKEMETGNYVIPKNSSIVKFVANGDNSRRVSGIRSSLMRSDFVPNVSRFGIVPLCGLLLVWAVKKYFAKGEGENELTRLEKEMLRRKIKMRKQKERFNAGRIEVVPEIIVPATDVAERPHLDKEELMNSIRAAMQSSNEIEVLDSPRTRTTDSSGFEGKIQEIREMAMHAREAEKREHSLNQEPSIDIETIDVEAIDELLDTPDGLKSESSANTEDSILIKEIEKSVDTNFAEAAGDMVPGAKGDQILPTPSTSVGTQSKVEESSQIARKESQGAMKAVGSNGSGNSIGQSTISKEASRKKPRVIRSVAEAREYLTDKQNPEISCADLLPEVREDDQITSDQTSERLGEECAFSESSHGRNNFSHPRINGLNGKAQNKSLSSASALDSAKDESSNPDRENKVGKEKNIRGSLVPDKTIHSSQSVACKAACQDSSINEEDPLRTEIIRANTDVCSSALQSTSSSNSSCLQDADFNSDQKKKMPEIVKPAGLGEPDTLPAVNVFDDDCVSKEKHSVSDGLNNHDVSDENHAFDQVYAAETPKSCEEYEEELKIEASTPRNTWLEKNFDELKPVLEKMGAGFTNNYEVAREKVKQEDRCSDLTQLMSSLNDNTELEWMNNDNLREIVFKVRDNEIAGLDPFHSLDDEDKITFFKGLEEKVERESNKLSGFHEWLHSNIENLDYGADGISLYDPPEKIIPRWKGAPFEKIHEFLASTPKAQGTPSDVPTDFPAQENLNKKLEVSSNNVKPPLKVAKKSKTVIESSNGSVKPGKRNGKEQWQHTKKHSRGFLESFNSANDPEIKEVMKDMGKDLDRWITEEEIKKAANHLGQLPRRSKAFVEKKLSKLKSEVEQFGTQAVLNKYREYSVDEEEDYLWWLDLPYVLCIELYTKEGDEMKIGFYTLEMAEDLELEPKPYHVIAFEEPGECKNLCYIIQSHLEMIGKEGKAFAVAQPPKDAFRDAKANGYGVTVIRKGELSLNVDQPLEEVEELITEIGSKMYHDKIMKERSVDMRSVMKGVLATSKPAKRKSGKKRRLRKPKN